MICICTISTQVEVSGVKKDRWNHKAIHSWFWRVWRLLLPKFSPDSIDESPWYLTVEPAYPPPLIFVVRPGEESTGEAHHCLKQVWPEWHHCLRQWRGIRQISKEPGASRSSWEASLMSETRGIGAQTRKLVMISAGCELSVSTTC